jgi:hypothetical protein
VGVPDIVDVNHTCLAVAQATYGPAADSAAVAATAGSAVGTTAQLQLLFSFACWCVYTCYVVAWRAILLQRCCTTCSACCPTATCAATARHTYIVNQVAALQKIHCAALSVGGWLLCMLHVFSARVLLFFYIHCEASQGPELTRRDYISRCCWGDLWYSIHALLWTLLHKAAPCLHLDGEKIFLFVSKIFLGETEQRTSTEPTLEWWLSR